MNDDPRLAAWLEATETALRAAPAERLEALERANTVRADLQRSLEADPPSRPLSAELSDRLAAAEQSLAETNQKLRDETRNAVNELRRARGKPRLQASPTKSPRLHLEIRLTDPLWDPAAGVRGHPPSLIGGLVGGGLPQGV